MDVWEPYLQATLAGLPLAGEKIVFDRFHIMKQMNHTLDGVRLKEHRRLMSEGSDWLQGSKHMWLCASENLPERYRLDFAVLKQANLQAPRAWAVKETLRDLWSYTSTTWARKFFDKWLGWAKRSQLPPVKKIADMLKTRLANVLTDCRHAITNGVAEGLNRKIMTIKRKCGGFRNILVPVKNVKVTLVILLCYAEGSVLCSAQSRPPPQLGPADANREFIPFFVTTEDDMRYGNHGMVMMFPSDLRSNLALTEEALRDKLRRNEHQTSQPSTIYVSRIGQKRLIDALAPLVERVIVNFTVALDAGPQKDSILWQGREHWILNNIRAIRQLAPGTQLIACIPARGEPSIFGDRFAVFEELEWQVYAACGGNFQGIAWRGGVGDANLAMKIENLSSLLVQNAADISVARPISWVHVSDETIPLSALRTDRRLFVVLLNPNYLARPQNRYAQKLVEIPLDPPLIRASVVLTPPRDVAVIRGTTIANKPLMLSTDGSAWKCQFSFTGGGEILIFDLSGHAEEDLKDSLPAVQFSTIPESLPRRLSPDKIGVADELLRVGPTKVDDN